MQLEKISGVVLSSLGSISLFRLRIPLNNTFISTDFFFFYHGTKITGAILMYLCILCGVL